MYQLTLQVCKLKCWFVYLLRRSADETFEFEFEKFERIANDIDMRDIPIYLCKNF